MPRALDGRRLCAKTVCVAGSGALASARCHPDVDALPPPSEEDAVEDDAVEDDAAEDGAVEDAGAAFAAEAFELEPEPLLEVEL